MEGTRICSYHPGVVGRYFSVTLGKDCYGQSEGGGRLGMLQGCVEHEVCGGGMVEVRTCFFWKAHDADSAGALRRAARDGCLSVQKKTSEGPRWPRDHARIGTRSGRCFLRPES